MGIITVEMKEEFAQLFSREINRTYSDGDNCPLNGVNAKCECPKTLEQIRQVLNGSTPQCTGVQCAVHEVLGDAIH